MKNGGDGNDSLWSYHDYVIYTKINHINNKYRFKLLLYIIENNAKK